MSVCRTCLLHLPNTIAKFSLDNTLDDTSTVANNYCNRLNNHCNRLNNHCNRLQLKKMIEKCMPEMDLDICDTPVICENCYKLLMSAYKFRAICAHTEEKIYQFIEKNNLRLGESIDLSKLCNPNELLDIKIENENEALKEEPDEFEDMPALTAQTTLVQNGNETNNVQVEKNNETNRRLKRNINNSDSSNTQLVSNSTMSKDNESSKPKSKVQGNRTVAQNESRLQTDDESNKSPSSEPPTKVSKYERRPIVCDKCPYRTSKLELLKRHKKVKCGSKESPPTQEFKCDKCSYKTMRKKHLRRHVLVHGGPRPYVCGVCSKGFTEKSYLKYHMFKHQPDKPLPFKCQEEGCEYACARNCDLTAHKLTHLKDNSLFCRVCNKIAFSTKVKLVKHEKECTGSSKKK